LQQISAFVRQEKAKHYSLIREANIKLD